MRPFCPQVMVAAPRAGAGGEVEEVPHVLVGRCHDGYHCLLGDAAAVFEPPFDADAIVEEGHDEGVDEAVADH